MESSHHLNSEGSFWNQNGLLEGSELFEVSAGIDKAK